MVTVPIVQAAKVPGSDAPASQVSMARLAAGVPVWPRPSVVAIFAQTRSVSSKPVSAAAVVKLELAAGKGTNSSNNCTLVCALASLVESGTSTQVQCGTKPDSVPDQNGAACSSKITGSGLVTIRATVAGTGENWSATSRARI